MQWTVGGGVELEALEESSVLQTLSIQSHRLTWSLLRPNVLYCRLTEAIIPVAHHDPKPPTVVSGPAETSWSIKLGESAVIMDVKITCTACIRSSLWRGLQVLSWFSCCSAFRQRWHMKNLRVEQFWIILSRKSNSTMWTNNGLRITNKSARINGYSNQTNTDHSPQSVQIVVPKLLSYS